MLQFSTTTGILESTDGGIFACGYAGFGAGKLNPALEHVHDVGPIPRGRYKIQYIDTNGAAYEGKKAPVFRLLPLPGTNTFGRAGFLIHGDSVPAPGTASHGCVIVAHNVREAIRTRGYTELEVI